MHSQVSDSQFTQPNVTMRTLSPFEHMLWLWNQNSPMHAVLTAQVRGTTTVEQWRSALEATRQRHPLWSAVIDDDADGIPYFRHVESTQVPLHVVESEECNAWEAQVARELATPFDAKRGPLVRATLLHSKTESILILATHHSIADGMSLVYSIRDVLRAISGKTLEHLKLHVSQEEALGLPKFVDPCAVVPKQSSIQPTGPDIYRLKSPSHPSVKAMKLSRELTTRLRDRARTEQTTLHGALNAAVAIASTQASNVRFANDLRVCSTINNRKLIGMPEDCAVFFSASNVHFQNVLPEEFWTAARTAKTSLSNARSLAGVKAMLGAAHDILHPGISVKDAADRGGRLFLFDIHLSNLGNLPIESTFGDLTLESVWGPGVLLGFEGEQTIGASTLNGSLCLLHSSHAPLDSFLDLIKEILVSACAPGE
jgi:Condensation domain